MEDDPEQLMYELIYFIKNKDFDGINRIIKINKQIKCFNANDISKLKEIKNEKDLQKFINTIYYEIKHLIKSEMKETCLESLKDLVPEELKRPSVFQLIENNDEEGFRKLFREHPEVFNEIHPTLGQSVIQFLIKYKLKNLVLLILNSEFISLDYIKEHKISELMKKYFYNDPETLRKYKHILSYKLIENDPKYGSQSAVKRKGDYTSHVQNENELRSKKYTAESDSE